VPQVTLRHAFDVGRGQYNERDLRLLADARALSTLAYMAPEQTG